LQDHADIIDCRAARRPLVSVRVRAGFGSAPGKLRHVFGRWTDLAMPYPAAVRRAGTLFAIRTNSGGFAV